MLISFCRVDPTIGTDNVEDTPAQTAAEKNSVELRVLFAEFGFALRGDQEEELPKDDMESKAVWNQIAKQEFLELIEYLTPGFSPLILLVCLIALAFSFIAWNLI